ncbi:MAG: transcriptional regulator [Lachnospiraceae bacterium]|nr:transcriptional regulator [Lachnospiraceae bacterium]
MTYGDEPITFERNITTKTNQLLQILFCAGDDGISREQLIQRLLGKDNVTNPSNSLRITVFRLRKLFEEVLPGMNPVIIDNRTYYWNRDIDTDVDIHKFKRLIALGDESLEAGRLDLACDNYAEACNLYKGEFIPQLSGEEWAIVENIAYKNEYFRILKKLSELLMNNGEYERLYKYVSIAASLYPYENWQVEQMDCLMALNRNDEAMKIYEQTSKLFFGELGIAPSEALMDRFRKMGTHMINSPGAISDIAEGIQETEEENGAYFCSYPSFTESYRFIRRMIDRTGQSAYIMLCTITDSKGNAMQQGDKLSAFSEELMDATKRSLRKGDLFTQYSPNQLLILLMEITREDCDIVAKRIKGNLSTQTKRNGVAFEISTVANTEVDKGEIHFKENKSIWK